MASPGQTVSVGAGSYPGQSIGYSAAKASASARIVFQCASGFGSVIGSGLSGLQLNGAQHIELVGCDIRGDAGGTALNRSDASSPRTTDIVIRNGRLQTFHITSVTDFQILNNDIGHYSYAQGFGSNSVYADSQGRSRNVLIQGNTFQGILSGTAGHAECLFLKAVEHVQVLGNKMLGCPGLAIALYDVGSLGANDILIQNNFLDCATGYEAQGNGCYGDGGGTNGGLAVELSTKGQGPISNVSLRFNTLQAHGDPGTFLVSDPGNFSGSNVVFGNIGASMCVTGAAWLDSRNVASRNASCPGNTAIPTWGSVLDSSLHLMAGSPAIDLIPASACGGLCPAIDVDGQPRPQGASFDAGADEH